LARLIYVADQGSGEIVIFPESGKLRQPVGTIGTGLENPYGLYVDRHGVLYVANQSNNTVTVYPSGATAPSVTYSKDLDRPLYPIVDGDGNLFVGNADTGKIVEYLASAGTGFRILTTAGGEVDGMDFDRSRTLYAAYRGAGGQGSVEAFAAGATRGRVLGMPLNQPQGLVVDSHYNVLVAETGGTNRIDVFAPGTTTPSSEVELPNHDTPTQLSLEAGERALFVSALSGNVYQFRYPLAKEPVIKENLSTTIQGVAVSNDQKF